MLKQIIKKTILSASSLYSDQRRQFTGKTRLLFYGRNPMNYTMFRPMHKQIMAISDTRISFCFQTDSPDYSDFIRLGVPGGAILPLTRAQMRIWDAIVIADFRRPSYLWTNNLVYICHGVAAKNWTYAGADGRLHVEDYRYHPSLREYDLVFFHNQEDYQNAKQRGLLKREDSGEIIGMCCLDEMLSIHISGRARTLRAKYIPPRFLAKKVILYAPTWDSSASFKKKGAEILSALSSLDAFVIVKPHPLCITSEVGQSGQSLKTFLQSHFLKGNYLLVTDTPYEVMTISDMMISDFSSITFEYSLLRKPIILFEGSDLQGKVADKEQYEMLKRCCFVFQEKDEIRKETFSLRRLDRTKIDAMMKLQEKYFANPGAATELAVKKLIERKIIVPAKRAGEKTQAGSKAQPVP